VYKQYHRNWLCVNNNFKKLLKCSCCDYLIRKKKRNLTQYEIIIIRLIMIFIKYILSSYKENYACTLFKCKRERLVNNHIIICNSIHSNFVQGQIRAVNLFYIWLCRVSIRFKYNKRPSTYFRIYLNINTIFFVSKCIQIKFKSNSLQCFITRLVLTAKRFH